MGLSYKPNTSDMRESPALKIVLEINSLYDDVEIIEPNLSFYNKLNIQPIEALDPKNDIIIALVKHNEFMETRFLKKIKDNILIDACGLL